MFLLWWSSPAPQRCAWGCPTVPAEQNIPSSQKYVVSRSSSTNSEHTTFQVKTVRLETHTTRSVSPNTEGSTIPEASSQLARGCCFKVSSNRRDKKEKYLYQRNFCSDTSVCFLCQVQNKNFKKKLNIFKQKKVR